MICQHRLVEVFFGRDPELVAIIDHQQAFSFTDPTQFLQEERGCLTI
jgi:hypothetical protein